MFKVQSKSEFFLISTNDNITVPMTVSGMLVKWNSTHMLGAAGGEGCSLYEEVIKQIILIQQSNYIYHWLVSVSENRWH